MIIDVHAHFLPRLLIERFAAARGAFPGVELLQDDKGTRFRFPGAEATRPVAPKLADLDDRRQLAAARTASITSSSAAGWTCTATSSRPRRASPGAGTPTPA